MLEKKRKNAIIRISEVFTNGYELNDLDWMAATIDETINKTLHHNYNFSADIYKKYKNIYQAFMSSLQQLTKQDLLEFQTLKQRRDIVFEDVQVMQNYFIKRNNKLNKAMSDPLYLEQIFVNDKNLFQLIIKDNNQLCDKDTYIRPELYDEFIKDPVFSNIAKQINTIKDFEKGNIKLSEIDGRIFQGDYNMNRICDAITDKLYTAFKEKLEQASSQEEAIRIKELLDKKIEKTVAELAIRRELSLDPNLDKTQKEIDNYEV